MERLLITKKPGEAPDARRRRIANAITALLESDVMLRQEVALQLAVGEEILDYKKRSNSPLNEGLNPSDPDHDYEEC